MKFKDIEVKVQWGNGSSLKEHQVEYWHDRDDGPLASCYIASSDGKKFRLLIHNHHKSLTVSFTLCLDGIDCYYCTLYPGDELRLKGLEMKDGTIRPFVFSKLEFTDDDDDVTPISSKRNMDQLGVIGFYIYRVEIAQSDDTDSDLNEPEEVQDKFVLHENTKSDATHRVRLGDNPEQIAASERSGVVPVVVNYLDPFDKPYVKFWFVYYSQDVLQAEGIVPSKRARHATRSVEDEKPSIPRLGGTGPVTRTRRMRYTGATTASSTRRTRYQSRFSAERNFRSPQDLLQATIDNKTSAEAEEEDDEDEDEDERMVELEPFRFLDE